MEDAHHAGDCKGSDTGHLGATLGLGSAASRGSPAERRQGFLETDEMVHRKVRAALDYGLKPIICVGERAPNWDYLLFPRLVAQGTIHEWGWRGFSTTVGGMPKGVARLGPALEPEMPNECNNWSGGGCEDARVSYVAPLGTYVMNYVAFDMSLKLQRSQKRYRFRLPATHRN